MPLKSTRHVLLWAALTLALLGAPSVLALEESDRLWRLGTNAFRDRFYPTAQQALERFIARSPADPRVPDAWLTLGKAQLALDDLARAAESFERALAFEPPPGRSQEARFWAAETLFRLKRYDEARAAYGAVIRADAASPLAPDAMYGLAVTELTLRRLEPAIASYRGLVQQWPEYALMSQPALALGRTLEYEALMAEAPPIAAGLYRAGVIAGELGHEQAQEAAWMRLGEEFPEHRLTRRATLGLAAIAYKLQHFDESLALARTAALSEDTTVRVEALLLIGEAGLTLNRYSDALEEFEAAAMASGTDTALRFRALAGIGAAYEAQRQWADAVTAYQEIVDSSSDPALSRQAGERLAAVTAGLQRSTRQDAVDRATAVVQPPPLAMGPAEPPAPQIAKETFPSVVLLLMQDRANKAIRLGTGFFVRADVVATNFHVIDGTAGGHAKVVGQDFQYEVAGVIASDERRDLALLQIKGLTAPPLPLEPDRPVAVGEDVYVVGNPEGLEGTFSHGIVSGIRHAGPDRRLQITAPISEGSSGGPVLNKRGKVIGIAASSLKQGQNLNFAVPVSYLLPLLANNADARASASRPREPTRDVTQTGDTFPLETWEHWSR